MERAFRPDKHDGEGLIRVYDVHGKSRTERINGQQYLAQLEHFAARIRGDSNQDANNQVLEQASLIDACQRALRSGRVEPPVRL